MPWRSTANTKAQEASHETALLPPLFFILASLALLLVTQQPGTADPSKVSAIRLTIAPGELLTHICGRTGAGDQGGEKSP